MTDFPENSSGVIGLAWFWREDYPRLLGIFEDAHEMPATWEEWEQAAKKVENRFKAEGYAVERVHIDPDTFPAWCRSAGVRIVASARSRFTAETVASRHAVRK
jgi:hypothetical protein